MTAAEECTENQMLSLLFDKPFMSLSMQTILNILVHSFKVLSEQMEEKTRRSAWSKFLDRTVFHYIQCLLVSSSKIGQQYSTQVLDKIKADQEHIKDRFVTMMSNRACNAGLEVLNDLTSFFECSPEFISVPCEKLRRTQGAQFNDKVVKALMGLRQDLDRVQKKEAIKICTDIFRVFEEDEKKARKKGKQLLKQSKNQGLFAVVD